MAQQQQQQQDQQEPAPGSIYSISLPGPDEAQDLDQDAEWCTVQDRPDAPPRRIRFHDYAEIYAVPGLYERLFHELLQCRSPAVVRDLLATALLQQPGAAADDHTNTNTTTTTTITPPPSAPTPSRPTPSPPQQELRVLDLGAGNGMVGEELRLHLGATLVVGVDISPTARAAAARDRPWVYRDYLVLDMARPVSPEHDAALRAAGFTAVTCVAALGYGDVPVQALARALDYLAVGGLLAVTIKERFLREEEDEVGVGGGRRSGFAVLIGTLLQDEVLRPVASRTYCHRLSVAGRPLEYQAIVARKTRALPPSILEELGEIN